LSCPAVTLDRRGQPVEANEQAQLQAESGALPFTRGGLQLSDPSEHRRFLEAVKDVSAGASLRTLVLTQGRRRFEIVCMAFHPRMANGSGTSRGQNATVLVLISPLLANSMDRGDGPSSMLGSLTVAERRVATVAASGISNADIAGVLGVSLNTVKTHLRRVYSKLDVKRQSELIILLNNSAAEREQAE
jgi:DNA-binding CsgD family transcriptional regulator